MLTEKTQRERHLPVILSNPPAWAISSPQAAEILGCRLVSSCTASECAFAVWPRKFIHEVNQDQLTEEILASIKIHRNRLQYSLLLEDFFSYAQRHGWVEKSE